MKIIKLILLGTLLQAYPVLAQYPATNDLNGWNSAKPLDTDPVSQGAGAIRQIKGTTAAVIDYEHQSSGRHIRFFGTDSGTTNAIRIYVPFFTSSIDTGMAFGFIPAYQNTGPSTLEVLNVSSNSFGAKPIIFSGVPVPSGVMPSNLISFVMYDGVNFELIGGSFSNLSSAFSTGGGGMYFISSMETGYVGIATDTNDVSLGTFTIPPNNYTNILVQLDITLAAQNSGNPTWSYVNFLTNGTVAFTVPQPSLSYKINGVQILNIYPSTTIPGGQTSNWVLDVHTASTNHNPVSDWTIWLNKVRLIGIR